MSNFIESKQPVLHHADWLASRPFFFNNETGVASYNINDVIDFTNVEFDEEGLLNYLDFGYSVFGRTPIKNVHFLRPNQSVFTNSVGKIEVTYKPDEALNYIGKVYKESDVWDRFRANIDAWRGAHGEQQVLVPTSGGYDSRLLNYFYPRKDLIFACTYGISSNQMRSHEVIYAREICRRLGINWSQVELGDFHEFFDEWDELYGISTHAHGMYQWEFFNKIRGAYGTMPMLSGVVGDAWAGSASTQEPKNPGELVQLGYGHGIKADSSQCLLRSNRDNRESEFINERDKLQDERYRVLYLVRTKLTLLSYLLEVPRALGFQPYSPFLNIDVAMPMLTIEFSRWKNRVWQREFMDRNYLNVEADIHNKSFRNDLNMIAMHRKPLYPLDTQLLSRLFRQEYLEWINRTIRTDTFLAKTRNSIYGVRYLGGALRRAGLKNQTLIAYFAYLVLKPIDAVLRRSREAQKHGS